MVAHSLEVNKPGAFEFTGSMKGFCIFLAVVGIISFFVLNGSDHHRSWAIFLVNHFFFLSLAIGGLFFAVINWVTGAMWSSPIRRIAESFTGFLPVVAVSTIVLFVGMEHLYHHWLHPEPGDLILAGKAAYLNKPFFIIRNVIIIALWIFFAKIFIGNSIKQDQTKSQRQSSANKSLGPIFLILFAVTYSVVGFDQLMSLDPHWFSTMFGVYCFAGLFYSTLAFTCLITIKLKRQGLLDGIVNANHLHDLGKFMFAFTVFWAYIGFSQFMLIWYANLPEETGYFITRFAEGTYWKSFTVFLFVGKFVIPFFALIRRDAKRSEGRLILVAIWMLVMQFVDIIWMVQPQFFTDTLHFGLFEVGVTLGFLGLFLYCVGSFLSKNNIVAVGDPRLPEAVHHHHQ